MSLVSPDRYFSRITAIDIQRDLIDCGLTAVLLDIDNTIRSRETHDVPRDVHVWLAKARAAGIQFCLVSNNWHADIHDFAEELDMPLVAKAMKPLPPAFMAALRKLKAKTHQAVVIGDQISTDVVGAHALGMKAYLLQPLAEVDLRHMQYLRKVENMFVSGRTPEPVANATAEVHEAS
jgi:hypothetical protein